MSAASATGLDATVDGSVGTLPLGELDGMSSVSAGFAVSSAEPVDEPAAAGDAAPESVGPGDESLGDGSDESAGEPAESEWS
jgi:hypothetical protein